MADLDLFEKVGEWYVPTDPAELTVCESCE
jgi:hypothetical protein